MKEAKSILLAMKVGLKYKEAEAAINYAIKAIDIVDSKSVALTKKLWKKAFNPAAKRIL